MALSKTISGKEFESGFADHPGHAIRIEPAKGVVRVETAGRKIARSDRALVLREADYAPVIYIPREDADMDTLRRIDHDTWCPFKGRAAYFALAEDAAGERLAWSYEDPFVESGAIKDCLAFYPSATVSREDASIT